MASFNPQFNEVGLQFVRMYYQLMETDRNKLAQFYNEQSMMTFETGTFKGQQAIMEKLLANPASKYAIITCDCQPAPNNAVIAFIIGDLMVENNPPMKFAHVVQLFPNGNSYFAMARAAVMLRVVYLVCCLWIYTFHGVTYATGVSEVPLVTSTGNFHSNTPQEPQGQAQGTPAAVDNNEDVDNAVSSQDQPDATIATSASSDATPSQGETVTEANQNPQGESSEPAANSTATLEQNLKPTDEGETSAADPTGNAPVNQDNQTDQIDATSTGTVPTNQDNQTDQIDATSTGTVPTNQDNQTGQIDATSTGTVPTNQGNQTDQINATSTGTVPTNQGNQTDQINATSTGTVPANQDNQTDATLQYYQNPAEQPILQNSIGAQDPLQGETQPSTENENAPTVSNDEQDNKSGETSGVNENLQAPTSNESPVYKNEIEKYMDYFKKTDMIDHENEEMYRLKLRLTIRIVSSKGVFMVNMVSATAVFLTAMEMQKCKSLNFEQCFVSIQNKLFDRAMNDAVKGFTRGVLATILDCLALNGTVWITKYDIHDQVAPEIDVYIPEYVTLFNNKEFFNEFLIDASNNNGDVFIQMSKMKQPFQIPHGANRQDIGVHYSPKKYERYILKHLYPHLVTSSGITPEELAGNKKTSRDEPQMPKEEPTKRDLPAHISDDIKRRLATAGASFKSALNMPQSQGSTAPDIIKSPDIAHRVLSELERALLQVPKKLHGYKLKFEDIQHMDQLQEMWKEALVAMNIMNAGDDLRNVLDNHTFSYDQLKNLFELTYGMIGVQNYEQAKVFYDSADIPREAVETNLAKVRSLFQANTGTHITRLPPILKNMSNTCPVSNLITSLSTNDLIGRLQIMLADWLGPYATIEASEDSPELAILCAGAAVFLQQWRFIQLNQGFKEDGLPWAMLLQSFSHMAKGSYSDANTKKRLKDLINSQAAKKCRKYINEAGIVASTPYRTLVKTMEATSLAGAIGNLLGVNIESKTEDVVSILAEYLIKVTRTKHVGNGVGVCMALQFLDKLNKCFSVEQSSDFALYKLNLLTMDAGPIMDMYLSNDMQTPESSSHLMALIKRACNHRDPSVGEVVDKLIKLASVDGHEMLRNVLQKRSYQPPTLNEHGIPLEDMSTEDIFDDDDYVELTDSSELGFANDDDGGPSFIEIASRVDNVRNAKEEMDNDEIVDSAINLDNDDEMHQMYKSFGNLGVPLDLNSLKPIVFEIRMSLHQQNDEGGDDVLNLKTISVPINFTHHEASLLKSMDSISVLKLLLYRLERRVHSLNDSLPLMENIKRIKSLAKLKNLEIVDIPVPEHVIHASNDINTYTSLLKILKALGRNSFYFENHQGNDIPNMLVGDHIAKVLVNKVPKRTIVLQVIDPVQNMNLNPLHLDHSHCRNSDYHFYRHISL
ncbi:bifunctional Nuclear transport factor 2-Mtr2/Nuclear transport factor 2 [Babesia duncani]|uniref:Bifunctional Nuclear transport factor 2-Mtr2/Nuclear transport factor 2 n=1 Tax=Babesia duncani TaxID=323732 RepID=A0AAD9PH10_9APIC|nr:bifunctional Nuclear transport factor 2-Mtr2/Nuclear transport factor 2 [Babesia duncani]KAK2195283.1 bifunctional Nuclear transport factor 2-Mtr2/Nuclear transport factor 2 [Babesia duncani]